MKSFQPLRFFSLLLLAAIIIATVAWMKDLIVAVIFAAFQVNDYIVPLLVKRGTRRRGWILWACAFCAFAGAYHLANLFLMPSNHSPFHRWDGALISLVAMVGGLAASYYAPPARAKAVP